MKKIRKLTYPALFAALIAIGAYIRIPIQPVPLTLQLQFVNLAGLLLGKVYGPVAALTYLLAGLAGAPVFAGGGGGIGYVLRPTFGYLLGFPLGAYAAGFIAERKNNVVNYMIASAANIVIIYAAGLVYYYIITKFYLATPIDISKTLISFVLLPLPGDAVLCMLSAGIAKRVSRFIKL